MNITSLHCHGGAVFLLTLGVRGLLSLLNLCLLIGLQDLLIKLLLEIFGAGIADVSILSLYLSAGHGNEKPIFPSMIRTSRTAKQPFSVTEAIAATGRPLDRERSSHPSP